LYYKQYFIDTNERTLVLSLSLSLSVEECRR
jgi:hypothetical protein